MVDVSDSSDLKRRHKSLLLAHIMAAVATLSAAVSLALCLMQCRDIERYDGYHTGRLGLMVSSIGLAILGTMSAFLVRFANRRRARLLLLINLLTAIGICFYAWWPRIPQVLSAVRNHDARRIALYGRLGVNLDGHARWGWYWASKGETPLTKAAELGDTAVVDALLDAGADIDMADGGGRSALWQSIFYDRPQVMQLLLERGAQDNPLPTAVRWFRLDIFRWLLAHGTDVKRGHPIWAAIGHDQKFFVGNNVDEDVVETVIKELAQHGADLNAVNSERRIPLTSCIVYGHLRDAELLIRYGANVNLADGNHRLPLQAAASTGTVEIVKRLLAAGADVHSHTEYEHTPLYAALSEGNIEVARTLLDAGADINAEQSYGHSLATAAILGSSRKKSPEVLRFALDHGMSPLPVGMEFPIQSAVNANDVVLAEMLIESGADPNQSVPDLNNGWNRRHPVILDAIRLKNLGMVKLLISKGARVPPPESWSSAPDDIVQFLRGLRQP